MLHIAAAGFVTASGRSLDEVWASICNRVSATTIETVAVNERTFDVAVSRYAGALAAHLDPIERSRFGRTQLLAMDAARQVVCAAPWQQTPPERRAIVVGVGFGETEYLERAQTVYRDRPRRVSPATIPMVMTSSVAAHLAHVCDVAGPVLTVASACSSGADAIGVAASQIQSRRADVVLIVGVDSSLTPTATWFFHQLGALSATLDNASLACRPFDRDRTGFVLGEGAAALLLTGEAPEAGLGTVLGYASTHGGESMVAPGIDHAVLAMRRSLVDARLSANDIVAVNAHGTSTVLNDQAESKALHQVFSTIPPITANKGATGHLLAASGVLEAVISAMTATTGVIPPTAGTVLIDPTLDVDVVLSAPRPVKPGPVLSNSFGFGGQNTSLVIGPAA